MILTLASWLAVGLCVLSVLGLAWWFRRDWVRTKRENGALKSQLAAVQERAAEWAEAAHR